MQLTGAQIIVKALIEQDVTVLFGYPGGAVLNIYDELYKHADQIRHVLTAHEQGAAHAADGYARASGKVGVVLATSGPGATNLVTGIATAYLDSIPLVAITGNVATPLLGKDSFQEVDIVGITMPVIKHSFMVRDASELSGTIAEAFAIAQSGRPGPVLIDVPKDVQVQLCEYHGAPRAALKPVPTFDAGALRAAADLIASAERPFLYCGGGVVSAGASAELMALADKIDAPIGTSMMGLSAVPYSSPRNLGMAGMHGRIAASTAKAEADLVIAVGVRFSDRATGNKAEYTRHARFIHIDIDPAEFDKNIHAHIALAGDVRETLRKLVVLVSAQDNPAWCARVKQLKALEKPCAPSESLTPYGVIEAVNRLAAPDTVVATDVGQHQMWVAQHYRFEQPRTHLTSGGLGTMGYGLGAAIGGCVGADRRRTVLFTGDGSFGMNLNELATAASQNLPVVIVLFNNGVLGMVRQWQGAFLGSRYSHTTLNRKTDFVKLAGAFGLPGYRASTARELTEALDQAFAHDGPVLVECVIDKDEKVLPMIPPGGSIKNIITE